VILPYTFHRLAALEFEAAEDSYETGRRGEGPRFTSTVEEAPFLLRQHPEAAPVVRGEVRAKTLKRYPYKIYYRIKGDSLRILAVAHQKRAPLYWLGRR